MSTRHRGAVERLAVQNEANVARELKRLAGPISKLVADSTRALLSLGKLIDEAHRVIPRNGRRGRFAAYVESLGIPRATAYELRNLHLRFGDDPMANRLGVSVAKKLARPSVSDDVRSKALAEVTEGRTVTLSRVDELVAESQGIQPVARSRPLTVEIADGFRAVLYLGGDAIDPEAAARRVLEALEQHLAGQEVLRD